MSVKFERDTFQQTAQNVVNGAGNGQLPGVSGKHPLAEKIGTALTGGAQNAGTKGYLAVRIFLDSFPAVAIGASTMRLLGLVARQSTNHVSYRPTSSSSSPTPSAPRCSPPAVWLVSRSSSPRGSPRTATSTATTLPRESPRWPPTAPSSALLWATS